MEDQWKSHTSLVSQDAKATESTEYFMTPLLYCVKYFYYQISKGFSVNELDLEGRNFDKVRLKA